MKIEEIKKLAKSLTVDNQQEIVDLLKNEDFDTNLKFLLIHLDFNDVKVNYSILNNQLMYYVKIYTEYADNKYNGIPLYIIDSDRFEYIDNKLVYSKVFKDTIKVFKDTIFDYQDFECCISHGKFLTEYTDFLLEQDDDQSHKNEQIK